MIDLHHVFLGAAVALTLAALLYLYRVVVGPTVFDRVLGLGGVATKTLLLVAVIGTLYGRVDMVIDIALGYALLNVVSGLAVAKYLSRRRAS